MNKLKSLLALAAVSSLLTACSQGNSAPPATTQVNPGSPSYSKLQLAVGTANIAGAATGVNVVSSLRQPNGESAVLLDTPSLTGPWTLPAAVPDAGNFLGGSDPYATITSAAGTQTGGPSLQDFASNALTGTSPSVHLGAPACDTSGAVAGFTTCPAGVTPTTTTFGMSGGVFGMGLQPANSTTNTTAYSYDPYGEPMFATCLPSCGATSITGGTILDSFQPWGGPPAFDDPKDKDGMGTRDGLHNLGAGLLGWNTGMTIVQIPGTTPATGTYTMNVAIPTGQNQSGKSSYATVTATGNIRSTVLLPTITAPTLTEDGAGGGTLSVTLPAGTTEGYVTITDIGPGATGGPNCQGSLGTAAFPVYYTILIKPGTTTYTLPDTIGPNTTQNGPSALTPSMTLCTASANNTAVGVDFGDTYSIQYFAMDYPLYEASYPFSSAQTPALAGSTGQADVTVSAPGASAIYSMHRNAPYGTVQARIRQLAMKRTRL